MSSDLIFELGKDEFLGLGKCAFYDQGKSKFLWVLLGGHSYDQVRHGSKFFCLDGKVQGHCDMYSVHGPKYATRAGNVEAITMLMPVGLYEQ